MVENLDYEMLNTIMKATAEMLKYNATLETAQKTLYAAFFTAGASIFAAGITIFGNYRINIQAKKIDFQNEYYKKILDKRIDAYEKLNELILDLHKFSSLSNKGKKKVYPLRFASIANVEELFEKIGDFHKSEIWISFSTVGIIHHYVELLATIVTDLRSNDDNFIVLKDYIEDCKYSALEKYTGKNKFDDLISNIEENLEWLRNKNMSAIVEERKLDYKSLAVGMALNEIIKSINNILIEKYMDDFKELHKIDDFLDFNQ